MGQKTDARIFRQGILKKNWESKNIEKNTEESSVFLYKTLEIQKYLNRFFGLYKIKIHSCKIFYSDNSLQVFVSFYITASTIYVLNKKLTKYSKKRLVRTKRTSCKKRKSLKTPFKCFEKRRNKKRRFKLPNQNIGIEIKKTQRTKVRKNFLFNNSCFYKTMSLQGFQEILLESLIKYTKNRIDISVSLQNLNRYKQLSCTQIESLKIIFKQLRKFAKNSFFKEAINILFINILKRKSAKLLAEFISNQFRLNQLKTDQVTISRKDNYFLGFLKQSIMLFVKYDTSCLTGVKIAIKGRFNRAPRARTARIQLGKFSLQSFNSKIDYYQSTSYTNNGTFGIKVWLCENGCYINACDYNLKKLSIKKYKKVSFQNLIFAQTNWNLGVLG